MSVAHSLSLVHDFGQLVAHEPSQQSSPLAVSQSVDCEHALGQAAPCVQKLPPKAPEPEVQQTSPAAVSHWLEVVQVTGQACVAVHIGCAKSLQHFGVEPEQSPSVAQIFSHDEVGAQTLASDVWFVGQHDCPWSVRQSLSAMQKWGHACGWTHALPAPAKSQQSSPDSGQSESALHPFGHVPVQRPAPPPGNPDGLDLPLHARSARTAPMMRVRTKFFVLMLLLRS
jgi:hypothetical protein